MDSTNDSTKELVSFGDNPSIYDNILPQSPPLYLSPVPSIGFDIYNAAIPAFELMDEDENQGTENLNPSKKRCVGKTVDIDSPADASIQPMSLLQQCDEGDTPRSDSEGQPGLSSQHSSTSSLVCPHCHVTYSRIFTLRRHIRKAHSGAQNFQCYYCKAPFRTNMQVRIHESTVHGTARSSRDAACPHCQRVFTDGKKAVNRHVKTAHVGILKFWCNKCSAGFTTPLQLKRHPCAQNGTVEALGIEGAGGTQKAAQAVESRSGIPDLFGSEWDDLNLLNFERTIGRAGSSSQHATERGMISSDLSINTFGTTATPTERTEMETSHHEIGKTINAGLSRKEFDETDTRQNILNRGMSSENQWIHCPTCNLQLSDSNTLDYHTRTYHSVSQTSRCILCNITFGAPSQLTLHMSTVHDNEASRYAVVCPMCGATLCERAALLRHIDTCHTGEQPHSCDLCPARFKTVRQLRLHQIALHNLP